VKVSVLIPCFNAERWIADSINSALRQTWPDKEVLVVDDGSTDKSPEIIRSFGDSIRFEIGPNRGANIARNRLLEMAEGDWLQYLDADDYLLHEKIARQMVEIDRRTVDISNAPMILEHWDERGQTRHDQPAVPPPHDPWTELVRWSLPGTGSGLWRRSAILDVGGWKPDQPCCQEHELYLRLLSASKRFQFIPTAGLVYRQWSNGTVCRKNPLETVRRRLAIVEGAEKHLQDSSQMTAALRDAIGQTRVECARSMYRFDQQGAVQTAALAIGANRRFQLPAASCFPRMYRWVYRIAGFQIAESLAALTRRWRTERPS